MKNANQKLIFCLILLLGSLGLSAQNYRKTSVNGKEFYEYPVEKSEGLFAISRKFDVTPAEILQHNPSAANGLQLGQVLLIPVVEKKPETPACHNCRQHVTLKKETAYSIAKRYNIPLDTLYKYNPSATNLLEGSVLQIPVAEPEQPAKLKLPKKPETKNKEEESIQKIENQEIAGDSVVLKNHLKIAYLLPFMLDKEGLDATASKFFEFYQGSLLAVDTLKKQGVSFSVYTYDTDRSDEKLRQILAKPELKTVDFIIGPAYSTHVKAVSEFARENDIRLVVPFSLQDEQTRVNPHLFQCNIGSSLFEHEMVERFPNDFAGKNIILLRFDSPNTQAGRFAQNLTEKLDSTLVPYKSITFRTGNAAQIASLMDDERENLLVILTKNHAEMLSAMPELNTIEKTFSVFGFSEWMQMSKTLEEILIHNTYFYSQFNVDYRREDVKRFLKKYAAAFDTDISKSIPHYNMLGYDITHYFCEAERLDGNDGALFGRNTRMLQSQFRFEPISETGGYINKSIFLINYIK